jgi:uncharacterized protein YoxC
VQLHGWEIGLLILSGAFAVAVIALTAAVVLPLRRTIDQATRTLRNVADATGPILGNVNGTIENVNTALGQAQVSLDNVNLQLARLDTITDHVQHVTANVANLSTIVGAAAASPLVKVAAFTYGVRSATAKRRRADEEAEVRDELKQRRRSRRAAR